MIKLAVAGAVGRTGRCVVECAVRDDRFEVVAALTHANCPSCGTIVQYADTPIGVTSGLDKNCDVLVDFTVAGGTIAWLHECLERGIPLVTGSTGHSPDQLAEIEAAASKIPIVKAANFSVGINLLLNLVGKVARELGDDYDIEIVEAHHRHKVDAPSGTALALLAELLEATGRTKDADAVFGRQGQTGERPKGQIGVHAVRMGDIVGRHEIHFSGPGESLVLTHKAHSRDTFAAGAIRAVAWIIGKPPGLYTMRHVVGENPVSD